MRTERKASEMSATIQAEMSVRIVCVTATGNCLAFSVYTGASNDANNGMDLGYRVVMQLIAVANQLLHDYPPRHHWWFKSQRSRHLNMKDWNMWLSLVTKLMWYHSSQQPWLIKRSSTKAGSERWVTEVVQRWRCASVQVTRQRYVYLIEMLAMTPCVWHFANLKSSTCQYRSLYWGTTSRWAALTICIRWDPTTGLVDHAGNGGSTSRLC